MFSSIVILILAVVSANAEPRFPNGRIVGGVPAAIESYPYQVSIQQFGTHICGGSIIAKDYVVTAAHCVSSALLMTIRAGSSWRKFGGSIHTIEKIVRHEKFEINRQGVPSNDIALIKVSQPFRFDDTRRPIDLYKIDEQAVPGVNATITGWGTTGSGWPTGTLQLQTVAVPIVEKMVCNAAYERMGGITDGQICAAYHGVGGKDACQGDSGGPLAIDARLAGVVSWGNGCAQPNYPGVYTEIAHYREWIDQHVESY